MEPGEELALAPSDQHLGQIAHVIEAEMPCALGAYDVVPKRDAGERHIEDGKAAHFFGMLGGVGVGDHAAHVVADDTDARPQPSFETKARMSFATVTL